MPGDFKVVRIKQVFRFNSVHINEVPLYCACMYGRALVYSTVVASSGECRTGSNPTAAIFSLINSCRRGKPFEIATPPSLSLSLSCTRAGTKNLIKVSCRDPTVSRHSHTLQANGDFDKKAWLDAFQQVLPNIIRHNKVTTV